MYHASPAAKTKTDMRNALGRFPRNALGAPLSRAAHRFAWGRRVASNAKRKLRLPAGKSDSLRQGVQASAQATAAGSLVSQSPVRFSVPVRVNYGESVRVVGNKPVLGCWDSDGGLQLKWTEGDVWKADVEMGPGPIEFKCVIVRLDGQLEWEQGTNRAITVAPDASSVLVHCEMWNTQNTSVSEAEIAEALAAPQESVESNLVPVDSSIFGVAQTEQPVDTKAEKETDKEEEREIQTEPKMTGQQDGTEETQGSVLEGESEEQEFQDVEVEEVVEEVETVLGEGQSEAAVEETVEVAVGAKLMSAGHIIPHIDKVEKGGEDAFFVSTVGRGAFGVADGVSSWAQDGVDPALYAKALMKNALEAYEEADGNMGAQEVMAFAQYRTTVMGSSTACIAVMKDENTLQVANLGDSGFRVIRDGKVVFASESQEYEFNFPYQLTHPDYTPGNLSKDADVYDISVLPGDVIVMGSDGLFDNMWDEDLQEIVERALFGLEKSELGAQSVAKAVALVAHRNAQNTTFYSPWTEGASKTVKQTGFFNQLLSKTGLNNPYLGGKMDDCCVVAAFVSE